MKIYATHNGKIKFKMIVLCKCGLAYFRNQQMRIFKAKDLLFAQ